MLRALTDGPRTALYACLGVLVLASWFYLGWAADGLSALCAPGNAITSGTASLIFGLWLAMALAMMLPSGFPMISTYLDIAGAATLKRAEVAAPAYLVAGYLSVWAAFAALINRNSTRPILVVATPPAWIAGLLLVGAGAYQFSSFKHACLSKCRQPLPLFMSRWSVDPRAYSCSA